MPTLAIRNGTIVTQNAAREVRRTDLLIRDDRIAALGFGEPADQSIDATGCLVIPGLIQSHVHLCQTMFRNLADDLPLLDWLRQRIWPLEAALDAEALRASVRLGLLELLRSGTTAILDMGTVRHTEVIFEELAASGIRARCGKCLMDRTGSFAPLCETTRDAIDESLRLAERWQGAADGRLGYAFAPRFAVSCTRDLLAEIARLSGQLRIPIHSHAAENRDEVALVEALYQRRNVELLDDLGATQHHLCLAHCIWVDPAELDLLARGRVQVLHCPSSNLKLGSGVAPVPEMLSRGVSVSLGCDGAPCNNTLDQFQELRLAALIQKPRLGPQTLSAQQVFDLATLGGALALGLEAEIGSIEPGKKADIAVIDVQGAHSGPGGDAYSQLVYCARGCDVAYTIVDGNLLMERGVIHGLPVQATVNQARQRLPQLLERATSLGFVK